MIKSIIKKLFRPLKWRYMAFKLLTPEYRTLLKEYGAINTDSDMRKYKFLIIKESVLMLNPNYDINSKILNPNTPSWQLSLFH